MTASSTGFDWLEKPCVSTGQGYSSVFEWLAIREIDKGPGKVFAVVDNGCLYCVCHTVHDKLLMYGLEFMK